MSFFGLTNPTSKTVVAGCLVAGGTLGIIVLDVNLMKYAREDKQATSAVIGVTQALLGAIIMYAALKLHIFIRRRHPRHLPALEDLDMSDIKRQDSVEQIAEDDAFEDSLTSSTEDAIWQHRPVENKKLYAQMKAALLGMEKLEIMEENISKIEHFSEAEANQFLALFYSKDQAAEVFDLIEPKIMTRVEHRRFDKKATMEADAEAMNDNPKIRLVKPDGNEATLHFLESDASTVSKPLRSRKIVINQGSDAPVQLNIPTISPSGRRKGRPPPTTGTESNNQSSPNRKRGERAMTADFQSPKSGDATERKHLVRAQSLADKNETSHGKVASTKVKPPTKRASSIPQEVNAKS
eukprot:GEMP01029672.1.p1 GENE.GEMP01029672.1~~GEMP01029672.1.p1  ORF type:complete len:352 (+),score=92.31 GEMP01029672.1:137-1192(+)